MPNFLARVFDHNSEGQRSESGYYIAEPDELEAVLTAYDVHKLSEAYHEGTDEVPNVELEEIESTEGGWISNFFGMKK